MASAASGGWTDVTQSAGLGAFRNIQGSPAKDFIVESIGGGCAFLDYNRDGKLDILLVRGSTLARLRDGGDPVVALFENQGGVFRDVSAKAGLLAARGWGMGVTVADFDNDGWPDFLITGLTRNFLFRNQRDGTFRETAAQSGLLRDGVWSTGAAFGDLDRDGNLDVYIAGYVEVDLDHLPRRGSSVNCVYKGVDVFCVPRGMRPATHAIFRGDGHGRFTDVTRTSGIADGAPPFYGLQPVIADFDGDGWPDIFVANDSTPNYLWRNLSAAGSLRFEEIGVPAGVAVNMDGREQASMGVDAGDYDGDGRLDLLVTNFSEDTNTLYRNRGDGTFEDASWISRIGPVSWLFLGWGAQFFDYDNDGRLDAVIANGHVYPEADRFAGGSRYRQRLLLHHNLGNGRFAEVANQFPALMRPGTGRGLSVGDFDADGKLDILVNHQDGPPQLLHNDTPQRGDWIEVALQGSASNRDGIGAVATVTTANGKQTAVRLSGSSYLSSSAPALHFGLGSDWKALTIEIRWPSGKLQRFANVSANQILQVRE